MSLIGKKAPNFVLPTNGGGEISLTSLLGFHTVLFFYPRDDTSGCTKEAIEFSERQEEFEKLNAKIIGVSKDSVKSHEKFIAKHSLRVPLISDEFGTLSEDLGVWKEKSMYGKTFFGIERSTFIINSTGEIVAEWRKVKVSGHVDEVLSTLKDL